MAPKLPVLQTGTPTAYTIQRMWFVFGLPCASTSTNSIRFSFRTARRNRIRTRRRQPDWRRGNGTSMGLANGFMSQCGLRVNGNCGKAGRPAR